MGDSQEAWRSAREPVDPVALADVKEQLDRSISETPSPTSYEPLPDQGASVIVVPREKFTAKLVLD